MRKRAGGRGHCVLLSIADGVELDTAWPGVDPAHPRFAARHLGQEDLCLILLAEASTSPVTFADLDALGFVAHPDGYAYTNDLLKPHFPDAFPGADRLRVRAYVNQIGQIRAPVEQGIGYTLLPRSGWEAYARKERLKVVQLPKRRWRELWLASRRGRVLSARLTHASNLIEMAIEPLG